MRKYIILFFSALPFLFACGSGNDHNGILKEDVMTHLLAEVHIIDGSLAVQIAGDSLYKNGTARYQYLFKQYHTDSAQFKRSVKYYTTQPEILSKMYTDVNTILQVKYDSLTKIVNAEAGIKAKAEIEKASRLKKLKDDSVKAQQKIKGTLPKALKTN